MTSYMLTRHSKTIMQKCRTLLQRFAQGDTIEWYASQTLKLISVQHSTMADGQLHVKKHGYTIGVSHPPEGLPLLVFSLPLFIKGKTFPSLSFLTFPFSLGYSLVDRTPTRFIKFSCVYYLPVLTVDPTRDTSCIC